MTSRNDYETLDKPSRREGGSCPPMEYRPSDKNFGLTNKTALITGAALCHEQGANLVPVGVDAGLVGAAMKKAVFGHRPAPPEEIAACALFPVSDAATMVNGGYTVQ